MLEWPEYSTYRSQEYLNIRKKVLNPGPGTPKAWAYPWCILNGKLKPYLLSLDFGCGSFSNFTFYISEVTNSLTVGVDISNILRNAGHVRFVKNAVDKIDFPSNFFDRIFSVSVLEHVPVVLRNKVLSELFRVLRPGGLGVFTIDYVFNLNDRLLEQLASSDDLGRIGSRIYGNYNFHKIISDHSQIVSPLLPVDDKYLPGSPTFDENRILNDKDKLIKESTQVKDVELFKYTTVGIIFQKHGDPKEDYKSYKVGLMQEFENRLVKKNQILMVSEN